MSIDVIDGGVVQKMWDVTRKKVREGSTRRP